MPPVVDPGPIPAHGGKLVSRLLQGEAREKAAERARSLPRLTLGPVAVSDLELIAVGALSPLTGFVGEADYRSIVEEMHLQSGAVWSIPVTLPVTEEEAARLRDGQEVALHETDTHLLGILELAGRYRPDKEREAAQVYRTTDAAHPGVARLYAAGPIYLAGDIRLINRPLDRSFAELRLDPVQSRELFDRNGWRQVVGFQTRNPIHRAHEYIQKTALEICDGLLLHPLIGETKADDIPAGVRIRSYQALLQGYYPADRVVLSVFPAAMRYAGPREAIFHALARQNYGCTHFIVGRDHAGVGKYYGTYDAQRIFEQFAPGEIAITPLRFEHTFYCRRCGAIVSSKTCPHPASEHLILSGTQVREMLRRGEPLPPEFTRPEVGRILTEALRERAEGQA